MTTQDFEELKDFILSQNKCFTSGHANAYKGDATQMVYAKNKDGNIKMVMPLVEPEDMFYIRNDMWMKHDAKELESLNPENKRLTFLDTMSAQLVAVVNNIDSYQLIEQLRNTVLSYDKLSVIPVTSSWNREQVIATELNRMKIEDVHAYIRRFKDESVVRISLSVSKHFIPASDITNN